jgi:hypothetical protein
MRPGRLATLAGILVATGALYFPHLAVDSSSFRLLTGGSLPSIWQEVGAGARPPAVLVAAALVALAFRPDSGAFDRWGGVTAVVFAGGAVAACVLAREAAAADAAVVSAALLGVQEGGGGAAAGTGYWLLIGGTAAAAAGAIWDLVGVRRRASPAGSVGEEDAAAV